MTETGFNSSEPGKEVRTLRNVVHCDAARCGLPAMARVDGRSYCLSHFIAYCYEKLETHNWPAMGAAQSKTIDGEDQFLHECSRQAADLASPLRGFENIDRARLFDIFLWASNLIAKREKTRRGGNDGMPPRERNCAEDPGRSRLIMRNAIPSRHTSGR